VLTFLTLASVFVHKGDDRNGGRVLKRRCSASSSADFSSACMNGPDKTPSPFHGVTPCVRSACDHARSRWELCHGFQVSVQTPRAGPGERRAAGWQGSADSCRGFCQDAHAAACAPLTPAFPVAPSGVGSCDAFAHPVDLSGPVSRAYSRHRVSRAGPGRPAKTLIYAAGHSHWTLATREITDHLDN